MAKEREMPVTDNALILICAIAALCLFVCGVKKKDGYKSSELLVLSILPCAVLIIPVPPDEIRALALLSALLVAASVWAKNDITSRFFAALTTVVLGTIIGVQIIKLFS